MIKELTLKNGLLDIEQGIVVHQVNCMNAIGAGLSGAICKKYPKVEEQYRKIFKTYSSNEIFGYAQDVIINCNLVVVNLFSQYGYGAGKKHTDYNKLINGLKSIAHNHPGAEIYIPYNIGCGLGGGDWNELYKMIKNELNDFSITVVSKG